MGKLFAPPDWLAGVQTHDTDLNEGDRSECMFPRRSLSVRSPLLLHHPQSHVFSEFLM